MFGSLAVTDFYPFGTAHGALNNLHLNRYLYGGKEYQDAGIVLGMYDFHARYYNPMYGRWFNQDPRLQTTNPYIYCGNSPMMYTDPTGEWFGLDDLIVAAIGGVVNVVAGLISGDITSWEHAGAAFLAGAVAAEATLYGGPIAGGAALGAMNSTLSQGFNNGWDNINIASVVFSSALGGATAGISSEVSGAIAPVMNKVTSGIASPVVQQAVSQSATGAATGFVVGTGTSLMLGSSFEDAVKAGGNNAAFGFGMGAISGTVGGLKYARQNKLNPWTGESKLITGQQLHPLNNVTARDVGIEETLNRIDQGGRVDHRNDGTVFRNDKGFLPEMPKDYYKEYVHPMPDGPFPGAHRIVIGAGNEIYYSPDHYKTFIPIKR